MSDLDDLEELHESTAIPLMRGTAKQIRHYRKKAALVTEHNHNIWHQARRTMKKTPITLAKLDLPE